VKCAVLPLLKKDGLPEMAKEIFNDLKLDFNMQYDEKDAIGKRYRRQDAIGTPFAVTIDHDSLEYKTVTLRDRDTMKQTRVSVSELKQILSEKTSMAELVKGAL
jgi:glycyl-tRNA synthetase